MRELSLNILDIAQNSVKAGARLISISALYSENGTLVLCVGDDGCGMDEETARGAADPFYTTRTTRDVGLGLPFFKMAAELTGGSFEISSEVGRGTEVSALFYTGHIDFIPLGDLGSTMVTLIECNPELDFTLHYRFYNREFTADTRQFRELLGEVPLADPEVIRFLKDYFEEQMSAVHGGDN